MDLCPRGMCECEWSTICELIGGLSGWLHLGSCSVSAFETELMWMRLAVGGVVLSVYGFCRDTGHWFAFIVTERVCVRLVRALEGDYY